ncbi:MAG: orotate phosphoribosyltransferase [Acidobacteria bacterium]|nr:orotate phosphoribosyltransferase [Acidobacteriota bacterium]
MHRNDVLDLFRRSGALLEGHFRLSSGLHSGGYLQCALVLQDPRDAETLGRALAGKVRGLNVEVVLSPAMGGLIIGHEVARALGARAIFAERVEGRLTLRRGFALKPGERVLVVEDVLTTGLSTRETIDVARAAGADVVGAAAIINRSESHGLDVGFAALADYPLPAHQPGACPLCAEGKPVVKPGSRGA